MSNADEFKKWRELLEHAAEPDIPDPSDLCWRAMVACVEDLEYAPGDIEDAAAHTGNAIQWAAFWLALGAVLVALIVRMP